MDDNKNMNLDEFDKSESDAVRAPFDGQELVKEINANKTKELDKRAKGKGNKDKGTLSDLTSLKKRFGE